MTYRHRIKLKLYHCLEHPKNMWHVVYHLGIFCYVLLTLCMSAIMSLDEEHGRKLDRIVFAMEAALAIYFTLEFFLRLWAVGINRHYHGWIGRLRYTVRWMSLLDMLIVSASLLLLVYGSKGGHFLTGPVVQNLRFFQILRMLHVDRRSTTWKIMEKVLRLHKTELLTAFYLSLLGLLVASSLVYIAEGYYTDHGHQGAFDNYGDALWWGVCTLFTIGYGDVVPKYWLSKLITCIFAITCVSLFTLTSSIIGVGLALMVQEKSRKKHIKRQTPLAVKVIQTFWREYMLRENFENIPFFKYTLVQRLIAHELIPYEEQQSNQQQRKMGGGSSIFGLLESIKVRVAAQQGRTISGLNLSLSKAQLSRIEDDDNINNENDESTLLSPSSAETTIKKSTKNLDNLFHQKVNKSLDFERFTIGPLDYEIHPPESKRSGAILDKDFFIPPTPAEKRSKSQKPRVTARASEPLQRLRFKVSAVESPKGNANVHIVIEEGSIRDRDHSPPPPTPSPPEASMDSNEDYDQGPPRIPARYVLVLIAIWRMKFLVAKKKFRLARNPYDLQDITDRVSQSESQQLARLRKVQLRMERLLGPPRPSLLTPADERFMTLAQRLQLVEMKMAELDKKADLIVQMATQLADRVSNNTRRKYAQIK